MFDDDFGAEEEAIETARRDADLEQVELGAAGDALYAACDEMGICLHGVVFSHRVDGGDDYEVFSDADPGL
ncbi:hypothetical protein [Nonomuraea lactucae]|uniref:hypothetical protein n=1 Tax=Nonomuraea lactucae TaxID=2249762 RepID=UPI000DE4B663|nr:hypothetical protein [Nonomuraea lactucae]